MAWFTDVKCSRVKTNLPDCSRHPTGIQIVYEDQRTHPCYLLVLFCKGMKALGPRVLAKKLCLTVSGRLRHPCLPLALGGNVETGSLLDFKWGC